MATREASHAGSWYSSNRARLSKRAGRLPGRRGVARKHTQSAHRTARRVLLLRARRGVGYKNVDAGAGIGRVFLLGPSHHVFLRRCALSKCAAYATPLGDLAVDRGVYEELRATGHFVDMDVDVDEAEHLLELHLPYIFKCFEVLPEKDRPTLVPIMVGALSTNAEATYGEILAPYLDDGANLFIVSSDFCHWGERFGYQPWDEGRKDVGLHEQIEEMDRRGMEIIESKDADAFGVHKEAGTPYAARTQSRAAPDAEKERRVRQDEGDVHQVRAEQRGDGWNDSSVSYASAVVFRDA